VVERDKWFNPSFQQFVYYVIVESNSLPVDVINGAFWEQSWPGKRHPEGLDPQLLHHLDILCVLVIEVISHVPRVSIVDPPWDPHEIVPDPHSFPINVPGAFNLVGSCSCTPGKIFWIDVGSARNKVISELGRLTFWQLDHTILF